MERELRVGARRIDSSNKAAATLQTQLEIQTAAVEEERRDRALATQSLESETGRCGDMERSLEHERSTVRKLTDLLINLRLPKEECSGVILPDDTSLGFFHEWQTTKTEVACLQRELQRGVDEVHHKELIIKNLAEMLGV